MRLSFVLLVLAVLACIYFTKACEPEQSQHGCKISGASCTCGFGCKSEFIYKTQRACLSSLRARSSNICNRLPCLRGICIQTVQDPGYTCKCEGTGFFGARCEKACPTVLMRGMVFPHECIKGEESSPSSCHVSGGLISKLCKLLLSFVKGEPVLLKTPKKYHCGTWCTRIPTQN